MMHKDKMEVTEKILNLTLEIIFLLTGEDLVISKKQEAGSADGCQECLSEGPTMDQTAREECPEPEEPKEEETPEPPETTHSAAQEVPHCLPCTHQCDCTVIITGTGSVSSDCRRFPCDVRTSLSSSPWRSGNTWKSIRSSTRTWYHKRITHLLHLLVVTRSVFQMMVKSCKTPRWNCL
ncbi:hypothetical protein GDO81_030086 [Engystomops pustulosus]|uniref:Uncharacterized protein n=1 Tax=Engystomops pustulosus TaxID=76066 RepID=A0AAV6ZH33_ENGPU|nr:hypothetical protein GDO81_030086 [Engystomops pustulosus]